eukprot:TRINITY_DN17368_c0_g1_i1.p4 TRINITY_DN17368_c0_g1~~TRINITY_DN17368_c0_g1_i1.p4  ORF type:complete len:124 (+),score=83.11 TRINITY_DN17368_c0_g1_i1:459-830(+)
MIQKHKTIEEAIKHLDPKKYTVPEDFRYKESAQLFLEPEVTDPATVNLEWKLPDAEGIINFLVHDKGFDETRIRSGIEKLKKAKKKGTQKRLESFFGAATVKINPNKRKKEAAKRKAKRSRKK